MPKTVQTLSPLLLLTLWSLSLLLLRMIRFHDTYYDFMLLNVFLAWIPIAISSFLYFLVQEKKKRAKNSLYNLLSVFWILFLPNAPYLLTDFMHLHPRGIIPIWYDVMLMCSFTLLGLFQFEYTVRQMEVTLKTTYTQKIQQWFTPSVIILTSMGIYAGRFLRWNSWEVVTAPLSLVKETIMVLTTPYLLMSAITYISFMSIFLFLFHYVVQATAQFVKTE